jgi:transposase
MRSLNAELLTVVEVAQIFRVSKAMVYRMIRRGQLRAYRKYSCVKNSL